MATTELPLSTDPAAKSFEFIFDVALSTAIAANGEAEVRALAPNNRWLIHSLVHGRANHDRFHVHGYMDEGTTTTPFDMVVLNKMSRFHLSLDALKNIPQLRVQAADAIQLFGKKLHEHHDYIREHLEDIPAIRNWQWTADFSDPAAPAPLVKGHPQKLRSLTTKRQATGVEAEAGY